MAKKRLREFGRRELSPDEFESQLATLDAPEVPDMIAAILAATLVEYRLEQVLKRTFRRVDNDTWVRMTDNSGPLRDFHSKIVLGNASGSFDEDIRLNLNIVRDIRNAFAHARAPLTFEHREIGAELHKVKPVRRGKRVLQSGSLAIGPNKRAYLQLCMSLLMYFQLKLRDSAQRKEKRVRDNIQALEFLEMLVARIDARKKATRS